MIGDLEKLRESERLARLFHQTYEELAPSFGYETRQETRQFDPSSPNGQLMIAVCRRLLDLTPLALPTDDAATLQQRVQPWMMECFGEEVSKDVAERNHRFIEESLELAQACGMPKEDAYQLVEYVYGRPNGEPHQEVGGVMITLAALCLAHGLDMHAAGEDELVRIWEKIDKVRAKQAAKPRFSVLPIPPPTDDATPEQRVELPYCVKLTKDQRGIPCNGYLQLERQRNALQAKLAEREAEIEKLIRRIEQR